MKSHQAGLRRKLVVEAHGLARTATTSRAVIRQTHAEPTHRVMRPNPRDVLPSVRSPRRDGGASVAGRSAIGGHA